MLDTQSVGRIFLDQWTRVRIANGQLSHISKGDLIESARDSTETQSFLDGESGEDFVPNFVRQVLQSRTGVGGKPRVRFTFRLLVGTRLEKHQKRHFAVGNKKKLLHNVKEQKMC